MLAMLGLKKACAWLRVAPVLPTRRLSRHEARHSRCSSAIGLMQIGNTSMTNMSNGTIVTDLDNTSENQVLTTQGYTIRHIETYHDHNQTCIVWDAPELCEVDLPY